MIGIFKRANNDSRIIKQKLLMAGTEPYMNLSVK